MKNVLKLIIVLFATLQIQAQQKEIIGTISDGDHLPLPGVNVLVKGTENSITTDFDGNYTIKANIGDVLVFSYVGVSEERIVGEKDKISFVKELQELFTVAQMGCYFGRSRIADNITYQYVEVKISR